MRYAKLFILVSSVLALAISAEIGDVVQGNYNEGEGNTILSSGNFVKGDGNIVASLDSDVDIFGGDPFFAKGELFDPVTTPPPSITSPIYPGPIPTAVTTEVKETTPVVPEVVTTQQAVPTTTTTTEVPKT